MKEEFQQFPQTKNLALERAEAVKLHNEILGETNNMPEGSDSPASDKISQMGDLREKVGNIDKYKELAKPFIDRYSYKVGDTSNVDKLKIEKQKIDMEIEKMQLSIQDTKNQLNELRKKLGMESTDDIPSLSVKNERLPYLQGIQSDLENKISFETKKLESQATEKKENSNIESKNLDNSIESISFNLSNLSRALEGRKSQGYGQIFKDETAFSTLASQTPDISNFEEIKSYFLKLKNVTEAFAKISSVNDSSESLYDISRMLRQLSETVKEFSSKIKDETKRKELSSFNFSTSLSLDQASLVVSHRAQALEVYKNIKM